MKYLITSYNSTYFDELKSNLASLAGVNKTDILALTFWATL